MKSTVDVSTGVTAAHGFAASGVAAGIKNSGARDLALIVNEGPHYAAAGVFTRNAVKAAPVLWSQEALKNKQIRAVVLNSGCANAATGSEGFQDTLDTAERAAYLLHIDATDVAVCSTGLIGQRLPMDLILSGVDSAVHALATTPDAGTDAADAVLTTDKKTKQASVNYGNQWTIGGFAKGAGMLAPNLATMLAIITTDVVLGGDELDYALRAATKLSFDRLDVDGGTSTNDTVLLLASGASGVTPDITTFIDHLTEVSLSLVHQLRTDAEGATKEIDIHISGAASENDAIQVGRTVAEDNLVKTALFGSDPNWGRIAMAVGRSAAFIDPHSLSIAINGVTLCTNGTASQNRHAADLSGRQITITIDLGIGEHTSTVFTTDLSHDYVEENSAYSS